jgi:general secretion pathway protein I
MNRSNASSDGFTLIEVLVALAILSISLGVFFRVFSTSLDGARINASRATAISLLETFAASVGSTVPLRAGTQNGSLPEGYQWRIDIVPYGSADDQKAWSVAAYKVETSVFWQERGDQRSVSTQTLRIGPREFGK